MKIQIDEEYPDFCYNHIVTETPYAILFDMDGDGTRKIWLPRSQVEFDDRERTFNIPRWLAEKKELI